MTNIIKSDEKIDYLTEDPPIDKIVANQKFVCVSFLSPKGLKNTNTMGIKIRGSYETYDEAKLRAEELRKEDPYFDIFVGEVGKWLPINPDPDDTKGVQDQEYAEKELQEIMAAHKDKLSKNKQMFDERIQDQKNKAAKQVKGQKNDGQSADSRTEKKRDELRKKLELKKKNLTPTKPEETKQETKQEGNNLNLEEDKQKLIEKQKQMEEIKKRISDLQKNYDKTLGKN